MSQKNQNARSFCPNLVQEQKKVAEKTAEELKSCRKELAEATSEIQRLKSAAKNPPTSSQFTFKKKSCEEQHKFVEKIQRKLDDALSDVPDGPAKTALAESKSMHDWRTVE